MSKISHCYSFRDSVCIGFGKKEEFHILSKGRGKNMCNACWNETLRLHPLNELVVE